MASILVAIPLYFESSGSLKVSLLRLMGVSSGDAINVGSVGPIVYDKVICASFMSTSQQVAIVASVTGTVITMTNSGMSNETVTLMIMGE